MKSTTTKAESAPRSLGIGSGLAAGAMMLCHMNSSGLTRYDNLMADLGRLNTPPQKPVARRSERPLRKEHSRWMNWISR